MSSRHLAFILQARTPFSQLLLRPNHLFTTTRATTTTKLPEPHHSVPLIPFQLSPRRAFVSTAPFQSSSSFAPKVKPTMSSPLSQPVKIALIQLASGTDKAANLTHAREKVLEAAKNGAKIVILPECFNSPYGCSFFPKYAEPLYLGTGKEPSVEESPSYHALQSMAKDAGVYLVGGSIPEKAAAQEQEKGKEEGGKETYYNTLMCFGPEGQLVSWHRKVHLFDISIPGGITFRESDVLSPGSKITMAHLPPYGHVMLGICYDIRFPEPAILASRHKDTPAFALIYPGAFNLTTGPMHWQLLARARAVDNQVYVAVCSPARDMDAEYHAWGHSLVSDPMARVLGEAKEGEETIYAELDPEKIQGARQGIPMGEQRRFDVYPEINGVEGTKWG